MITWAYSKTANGGFQVSTKGDARFSALTAKMPDGRTIEEWYQCDVKGYQVGGTDWKIGKGRPPITGMPREHLWEMYLGLWRIWAIHNPGLMQDLLLLARQHNNVLVDSFARGNINQARALAQILNEWFLSAPERTPSLSMFELAHE
jgi:hypothetical protein